MSRYYITPRKFWSTPVSLQGNIDIYSQQVIKTVNHPHQLRPCLPSIESDKSFGSQVAIASVVFWVGGEGLCLSGI